MPTDANGNVLAVADITAGHWDTNARAYTPNQTPLNAVQVTVRRSALLRTARRLMRGEIYVPAAVWAGR